MLRTLWAGCFAAVLSAGCASYDGRGLEAGRSTAAEVEGMMGTPAARVAKPDGSSVLYYPRGPIGRHTYAVTLESNGIVRGRDQLLDRPNFDRLMAGSMTSRQVRELLGPPHPTLVTRMPRQAREVWEYRWLDFGVKYVLAVQFSDDGILREVINQRDDYAETNGTMP